MNTTVSSNTSSDRDIIIREIAKSLANKPGATLPILHTIQDRFGYLPASTASTVAEVMNLSRAEVHGIISFYHLFRTTPPGKKTLFVCRSEACQSMGGTALVDEIKDELGIGFHETTDDQAVSLEPIYCLGNCACAPAVMVDEKVIGRATVARIKEALGS